MSDRTDVVNYVLSAPRCIAVVARCRKYRSEVLKNFLKSRGTFGETGSPGGRRCADPHGIQTDDDGRRPGSSTKSWPRITSGQAQTGVDQVRRRQKIGLHGIQTGDDRRRPGSSTKSWPA